VSLRVTPQRQRSSIRKKLGSFLGGGAEAIPSSGLYAFLMYVAGEDESASTDVGRNDISSLSNPHRNPRPSIHRSPPRPPRPLWPRN
jgi:hypothetical protein